MDANFDKYDIPMDVIWLDIEHTDGKRWVKVFAIILFKNEIEIGTLEPVSKMSAQSMIKL